MNPKVKAKWVKALRSGKYKQIKGKLRIGDSFCCLGVLCDLYDKSKWIRSRFMNSKCFPPLKVVKWAELENERGSYKDLTLSRVNDSGKSFKEIADIIEENL